MNLKSMQRLTKEIIGGVITGIGVDIEDVRRFSGMPFSTNKYYYKKIFTEKEIAYSLERKNPYPHFAARFCAKEATIKALGKAVDFKDIEVMNTRSGMPILKIKRMNKIYSLLSMSHGGDLAIAFVVLVNLRVYDEKMPSA